MKHNASLTPINLPPQSFRYADLTADGRWLATSGVDAGVHSIWIADLVRRTQQKIDLTGGDFGPLWGPDGRLFTFTSLRKGHFDVWQYRLDEGRPVEVIGEPWNHDPRFQHRRGLLTATATGISCSASPSSMRKETNQEATKQGRS